MTVGVNRLSSTRRKVPYIIGNLNGSYFPLGVHKNKNASCDLEVTMHLEVFRYVECKQRKKRKGGENGEGCQVAGHVFFPANGLPQFTIIEKLKKRKHYHPKFKEAAEVHKLKVPLKELAKSLPIGG
ncbi:hypothetical protein KQX54_011601 [Cotesia glomerata]|uniref:Uncharacterized protein n=1 Tax=Cotesia glomerata TaxID=32391 RepID=A0AAV7IHI5_COTGL|nr:hypothetical protein KQX54_011601 [Cotesia glomerata]